MLKILPLLIFTLFAGASAGAAVMRLIMQPAPAKNETSLQKGESQTLYGLAFSATCIILLGIGLCGTLAHLGQPLRFINGLANPGSGISQEAYWSIALGILLLVEAILNFTKKKTPAPLPWITAIAAVGLMCVTGVAYWDCLGVVAWSGAATLPLFVLGDLALGCAVCAVFCRNAFSEERIVWVIVAVLIALAVVIAAFWLYLSRNGMDQTTPLALSLLIASVLGCVATILGKSGKLPAQTAAISTCCLITIGVLIARAVFFSIGMA